MLRNIYKNVKQHVCRYVPGVVFLNYLGYISSSNSVSIRVNDFQSTYVRKIN